ncbi:MAG: hypothetical protein KDJ82_11660, partial [Rhodobacteraceae bacterium]|nr:hypothetical protein [Paracoccaceae bacterium]
RQRDGRTQAGALPTLDYGGDLEIALDGETATFNVPNDWTAKWQGGRAVSIHTRRLVAPFDVTGKTLKLRP